MRPVFSFDQVTNTFRINTKDPKAAGIYEFDIYVVYPNDKNRKFEFQVKLIDAPPPEIAEDYYRDMNTPPFFNETEWFESQKIHLKTNQGQVEYRFPKIHDYEDDNVQIKVDLADIDYFVK